MSFVPLLLLWALSQHGGDAPKAPKWPGQKHPPPNKPAARTAHVPVVKKGPASRVKKGPASRLPKGVPHPSLKGKRLHVP